MEEWKTYKRTDESESFSDLEAARQRQQREQQHLQELVAAQEDACQMYDLHRQAEEKRMELARLRIKNELCGIQSCKEQPFRGANEDS